MPETTPLILGNVTKSGAADRLQRAGQAALSKFGEQTTFTVGQVVDNDIDHIAIDLTGVELETLEEAENGAEGFAEELRAYGISEEPLDAVHASTGVIRLVEFRAEPLLAFGTPCTVLGTFTDVPITWLEDASGRLAIAVDEKREPFELVGLASFSVPQDDFIESLRVVVRQLVEEEDLPFDVELRQVRITEESPHRVRVEASAKVSKGFVSATAIGKATLELDPDLVLHVRNVEVTSRNPIIAGLLKLVEKRFEIDPIPLIEVLGLGDRQFDITISVGDTIDAKLVLGDPHAD